MLCLRDLWFLDLLFLLILIAAVNSVVLHTFCSGMFGDVMWASVFLFIVYFVSGWVLIAVWAVLCWFIWFFVGVLWVTDLLGFACLVLF